MQSSVRRIPIGSFFLEGILSIPLEAQGIILFVHGSGSSRLSPRNNFVARVLNEAHFATFLVDLLSKEEDLNYETRFDIDLLTKRVEKMIDWIKQEEGIKELPLGLFGASTGAAAAIQSVITKEKEVLAIVSRGGRPDLAKESLPLVKVPTLLIVGGEDGEVIKLNEYAYLALQGVKKLEIIPHATHLFEEPGCLEQVAELAKNWFFSHLT
ncbi:MAG: alpha/beta hydrolase, partial [Chlamydiota bacterium]